MSEDNFYRTLAAHLGVWFFADLGPYRALATLAMFAGSFAGPLLAPAFAVLFLRAALFGNLLAPTTPLEIIGSTLGCFLAMSGVGSILWPLIVGMRRQALSTYWPALFFCRFGCSC